MKYLFFFSFLLFSTQLLSYSFNKGEYGEELYWANPSQAVYFNTYNDDGMTSTALTTALANSAAQFQNTGFSISTSITAGGAVNGRNDIYFTNDSSAFGGSSVLAVTKVSFEESTGSILEADILINDIYTFDSDLGDPNYIGDVLTHEFGHLSGLGHSQVQHSSMFYSLVKGQNTFHHDDISGVKHLYKASSYEISGTVVGGTGIGVFGAHVQAIANSSGEVAAAAVSESDGSFIIAGLSNTETYYLYIEPLDSISNLPSHYSTVKNNFCLSGSSYRGTFFQSCRRSEEGKPQGISLAAGSKNVGSITIGCDLSAPVSYMENKPSVSNVIDIVGSSRNAGEVLTGYFSTNQADNNLTDEFEIDLSSYSIPAGDISLDIKVVSQQLYSSSRLSLSSGSEALVIDSLFPVDGDGLYFDSDGNPDLDLVGRIDLSTVADKSSIKFTITPESLTGTSGFINSISPTSYTEESFLPNTADYRDEMKFYLLIMTISKRESGVYTVISEKSYNLQDNLRCIDGPGTYSVTEGSSTKSAALQELEKRKNAKGPAILSCGTVGPPSGPGSGSGSGGFMVAFLLGAVMAVSGRFVRV